MEFKRNIADGIALISLLEENYYAGYDTSDVEWQANRIKTSGNLNVFYTYFDYLDFEELCCKFGFNANEVVGSHAFEEPQLTKYQVEIGQYQLKLLFWKDKIMCIFTLH